MPSKKLTGIICTLITHHNNAWFAKNNNQKYQMTSFMMIWITTGYNLRVARMSKGNIATGATAKVYHFHILGRRGKPLKSFQNHCVPRLTTADSSEKENMIWIDLEFRTRVNRVIRFNEFSDKVHDLYCFSPWRP